MIVHCTTDNIAELQYISKETFIETFASQNDPKNIADYVADAFTKEQLHQELLDENTEFYLLYKDNHLAGYLKVNNHQQAESETFIKGFQIERIYILAEFQGLGLGKQLLKKAIEIAKMKGEQTVWLGVWEKNIQAINFYERLGFVKSGEVDFYMGDERQLDYLMTLKLS